MRRNASPPAELGRLLQRLYAADVRHDSEPGAAAAGWDGAAASRHLPCEPGSGNYSEKPDGSTFG